MHIVNCLADTNTLRGWKLVKGAATELSQMQFANCWAGNSSDILVELDGVTDCIFSNWLIITAINNGISLNNCSKLQWNNFRLKDFNYSNTSQAGILVTNSTRNEFEGIVSTLNPFANQDFLEVGTSDINNFKFPTSNTGTLVGANSKSYSDNNCTSGSNFLYQYASTGVSTSCGQTFIPGTSPSWSTTALPTSAGNYLVFSNAATPMIFFGPTLTGGVLFPGTDNLQDLGAAGNRWRTVYAGTGAINTSDEREKDQWTTKVDPELRAWAKVDFGKFKFKDAIAKKGESARWHFGALAQKVKEAFESEGLNAFEYGLLCYDEWSDQNEVRDGDIVVKPAVQAGNRYGIRYEEALALECLYLRSKLN